MASPVSFSGLGSGVDTSAIVTQLMALERRPVTQLQTSITLANTRIDGLTAIAGRLATLRGAEQALRSPVLFAAAPRATSSDGSRATATATADAVAASYDVVVIQLARADVKTQSSALAAATADDVLHLTSAGTTADVAIAAGDSIAVIADKLNAAGAGISASVVSGRLRLTAAQTGAASDISLTSDGSLAANLGVTSTLAGRDAALTVDGASYTRSSNTIADVLAGATITLRASGSTTVAVDPAAVDGEGILAAARTFISTYNGLVGDLRSSPTDGLRQDLLARLNLAVTDTLGGRLASGVGISTGASTGAFTADSVSGRLVLDEVRLRAALASDPAGTATTLGGSGTGPTTAGIASRLEAVIGGALSSSGSITARLASERARTAALQASIDQMNTRLANHEALLRSQFTAMEGTIGQLRAMQARFSAAVGG